MVLAVVCVAFFVRLAWIVLVPNEQWSDTRLYDESARHLAAHFELRYETLWGPYRAWLPPGWPFFLSLIYGVCGPIPDLFKWVNLALACLAVYLTVRLGERVFVGRVAIAGGLMLALLPGQAAYVSTAQYEVFLTTLLLGIVVLLIEGDWTSLTCRAPRIHLLGVLTAWAVMTKPQLLPLPALAGWYVASATAGARRGLLVGVVLAGYVAVAAAGWTARNQAVLGEPVLFSTNGGFNLWFGNNPSATGGPYHPPPSGDPRANPHLLPDELQQNRSAYRWATDYIREHPLRFLEMVPRRLFYLFHTDTFGVYLAFLRAPLRRPSILEPWRNGSTLPEQIAFRPYALVLLFAAAGIFLIPWRSPPVRLLVGIVVLSTLGTVLTVGVDRHHVQFMPMVCLFAGVAVDALFHRLRGGGNAIRGPWRPPPNSRATPAAIVLKSYPGLSR